MTSLVRRVSAAVLLLAGAMATSTIAPAQELQAGKPIRIIVGLAAGGGTDVMARLIAQKMGENMKATVIVENKAGGNFIPALKELTGSPADGHTLFFISTSTLITQPLHPDYPFDLTKLAQPTSGIMPQYSDYAAFYFPWIKVFDLPTKLQDPKGDGEIAVPPSGHIAGIYARVDNERGVHKAPANEVVRGALSVEYQISKAIQDGLNPSGVNCIREMNNRIVVWGARTVGGDFNTDLKYINVRRTLLFLRESIDEGTQWVVFEPNDRTLWAKIVRNVTAFLTTVWRAGALFGSTPAEAFYVKCDDETNPPEERDLGRVTTEIGVAIVKPAEFVIFRISQWAGPQGK